MTDNEPLTGYLFTLPVDLPAALDLMEADHLTVDADRMLVIFRKTVLNVKVRDSTLEAAERITIEILDAPTQPTDAEDTLIEQFLDRLETTTDTDWCETAVRN